MSSRPAGKVPIWAGTLANYTTTGKPWTGESTIVRPSDAEIGNGLLPDNPLEAEVVNFTYQDFGKRLELLDLAETNFTKRDTTQIGTPGNTQFGVCRLDLQSPPCVVHASGGGGASPNRGQLNVSYDQGDTWAEIFQTAAGADTSCGGVAANGLSTSAGGMLTFFHDPTSATTGQFYSFAVPWVTTGSITARSTASINVAIANSPANLQWWPAAAQYLAVGYDATTSGACVWNITDTGTGLTVGQNNVRPSVVTSDPGKGALLALGPNFAIMGTDNSVTAPGSFFVIQPNFAMTHLLAPAAEITAGSSLVDLIYVAEVPTVLTSGVGSKPGQFLAFFRSSSLGLTNVYATSDGLTWALQGSVNLNLPFAGQGLMGATAVRGSTIVTIGTSVNATTQNLIAISTDLGVTWKYRGDPVFPRWQSATVPTPWPSTPTPAVASFAIRLVGHSFTCWSNSGAGGLPGMQWFHAWCLDLGS